MTMHYIPTQALNLNLDLNLNLNLNLNLDLDLKPSLTVIKALPSKLSLQDGPMLPLQNYKLHIDMDMGFQSLF